MEPDSPESSDESEQEANVKDDSPEMGIGKRWCPPPKRKLSDKQLQILKQAREKRAKQLADKRNEKKQARTEYMHKRKDAIKKVKEESGFLEKNQEKSETHSEDDTKPTKKRQVVNKEPSPNIPDYMGLYAVALSNLQNEIKSMKQTPQPQQKQQKIKRKPKIVSIRHIPQVQEETQQPEPTYYNPYTDCF